MPTSPKGLALFYIVIFVLSGAGVLLYRTFAAGQPPTTTTLTTKATDGVASTTICLNNTFSTGSGSSLAPLAMCMQTNDPVNPTKLRFGHFNTKTLTFTPFSGPSWAGWMNSSLPATLINTYSATCTNGRTFYGIGPVTSPNGTAYYYGEEYVNSTTLHGALYNPVSRTCGAVTGDHPANNARWASPSIGCPAGALNETSITQLASDVAARKNTVYCLAAGSYRLTSPFKINISNIKIIGDPLRRPNIDASAVTTSDGQNKSGFIPGAAGGVTLANLIVHRAPTPGFNQCNKCGIGVLTGPNFRLYNMFLHHNGLNGVNGHETTIENSDLYANGNSAVDNLNWTAGGVKMAKAFTIAWSYVRNNIGIGIWCDVGCRTTSTHGAFHVHHNYVTGNWQAGVRQEYSTSNTYIRYNVVDGNNAHRPTDNFGGIEVIDSQHVVVNYNILKNNWPYGVFAAGNVYKRPGTYSLAHVNITNNTMNGQAAVCQAGTGVTCNPNQ